MCPEGLIDAGRLTECRREVFCRSAVSGSRSWVRHASTRFSCVIHFMCSDKVGAQLSAVNERIDQLVSGTEQRVSLLLQAQALQFEATIEDIVSGI